MRRLLETLPRVAGTLAPETRRSLAALAETLAENEHAPAVREIADALGLAAAPTPIPQPPEAPPPADPTLTGALAAALDGPHAATRARVRAFLAEPERRAYGLPDDVYRAKVRAWLRELADAGFGTLAFPGITQEGDLQPFMVVFETMGIGDLPCW